jgi:ABC-type polysaccharide/polyol phosphate export permease
LTAVTEPVPELGTLEIIDVSKVPAEPEGELFYNHRPAYLHSAAEAWRRKDVMFTLAERDIRAAYKQAVLGLGWTVLNPVITLVIFTLLFKHYGSFQIKGADGKAIPYVLTLYTGLWAWGFFAGAVNGGASSLIQNKAMMAKTHFPRECFPLSQVLESAFTSMLALIPLIAIFCLNTFVPRLATLWVPLFLVVEIPMIIGAVLLVSSVMVQARDLGQVLPIFMQFAMFATPVIWPMSSHIHGGLQYSLIIPMGPVIDGMRNSMLLGHAPDWSLIGVGMCGSLIYLVTGYVVFKRLEVNFADLA